MGGLHDRLRPVSPIDKSQRSDEDRPTTRSTIYANIVLLAGLVPFGILSLKVIYVSDLQLSTMLTLTSTINVPAAFFGTFITVAMPFLLIGCFLLIMKVYDRAWEGPSRTERQMLVAGAFTTGATLTITLSLLSVITALAVPLAIVTLGALSGRRGSALLRVEGDYFLFILVPLLAILSQSTAMWLPSQQLYLKSGQDPIVYVLQEDDKALTVLDAGTSKVERIEADSVERRVICEREATNSRSWFSRSLLSYLGALQERTPRCDERARVERF